MSMERPYPEADAEMMKDESIDNGTAANLLLDQDVLTDEPLASGPDLAAQSRVSAIRARGLDFAREAESRARQNPWLAIAAASASALAVGFIVGRLLKRETAPYVNEEYPSGYDE